MGNYIIFIGGTIVSCLVINVIVFQFLEERNEKRYHSHWLYFFIKAGVFILSVYINLLNHPSLNILTWIIMLNIVNIAAFENRNKRITYRMVEVIILILLLSIAEAVGGELLNFIFCKFQITNIQTIMAESMEITFSKLIVLIFYYIVITKLWREDFNVRFTITQCLIEIIIILFSIANLAVILIVITKITSKAEHVLILVNMVCMLGADLYFLYFARFAEENNQLKVKLKLLEQQSLLQYEFYEEQEEKYNESIKILHDVNKHLQMIKNLYQTKQEDIAITYTQEISQMLMPLSLEEYTNNPILNVLLNDKKKIASLHTIQFKLDIGIVDLSFMEPIEVTTIFGNLLDNAIEACDKVTQNKYIEVKLDKYNDFIAIKISNSTMPIEKWHLGKPVSRKGKNHGIGLLNVENIIEKYNGNMILEEKNKKFSCNIIFNL
jgi:signal transduction histidine kinase